jgi:hypothetical protein
MPVESAPVLYQIKLSHFSMFSRFFRHFLPKLVLKKPSQTPAQARLWSFNRPSFPRMHGNPILSKRVPFFKGIFMEMFRVCSLPAQNDLSILGKRFSVPLDVFKRLNYKVSFNLYPDAQKTMQSFQSAEDAADELDKLAGTLFCRLKSLSQILKRRACANFSINRSADNFEFSFQISDSQLKAENVIEWLKIGNFEPNYNLTAECQQQAQDSLLSFMILTGSLERSIPVESGNIFSKKESMKKLEQFKSFQNCL